MIVSPVMIGRNVPKTRFKPPISREKYTLENLERAFPSGEWVEEPPVIAGEQEEMPEPPEVTE